MPRIIPTLLTALLLTGCSGWVEQRQIIVTQTPATFHLTRTVSSIGYHPVSVSEDPQPPPSTVTLYQRPHSPRLTANVYRDGSIALLVWQSGVPPFARPTGLNQPVHELLTALHADGIPPDHIRTSATHSPPGRLTR